MTSRDAQEFGEILLRHGNDGSRVVKDLPNRRVRGEGPVREDVPQRLTELLERETEISALELGTLMAERLLRPQRGRKQHRHQVWIGLEAQRCLASPVFRSVTR